MIRAAAGRLLVLAASLLLVATSALAASAPESMTVDPHAEVIELGVGIVVLADREDRFAAADVLAGRHDDARVTYPRTPPNLGYPRHPHWALIELRNNHDVALERLLVLWRGSTHRQQAHILVQPDGEPALAPQTSAGLDLRSRHSVIRLHLPPHSTTRIAVRLHTHTALSLDYRLLQSEALAAVDRIDYWFFGLLAGIVGAIGIYVLALYFALRERLYLLFAGFSVCNILYQIHTEGYAYLVWPEAQRVWGNALGTYSGVLFALLIIQFIRNYMSLPTLVPRLDRWLLVPVIVILCLVFIVYPFSPWLGNTLAALGVILGTVVSTFVALRGSLLSRPVWSFLIATLFFFALGVVHLLKRIGVLPDLQALALVLQLGSAATTIAFAIAVMERIRRVVEEKRLAQIEYADRLEHQVAARTAEMREAKEGAERALLQLQSTRKQLLEADKMASLGQLVAGVSHEVNTPLGIAVTASSHLTERSTALEKRLAQGELSRSELTAYLSETREAGAMIERNLERAAHLVRSFKQVSVDRTSDGRRRFDLAEQLAELIESLRVSWKRRPVSVTVDCADGIVLDSFPGALGQVITNLIQNALLHGFGPEQPGSIHIAARELDEANIELVVDDDGAGLDQPTLARIFDPFFTTKRNQGGTGLGLNIVYNLVVQKLGGEIVARSELNRGLRMTLHLPRNAPKGGSADPVQPPAG